MSIPRPRKVVLLAALVATLAVLCCAGGITAVLLGGLTDDDTKLNASLGCGKGGPTDPDSKLPGSDLMALRRSEMPPSSSTPVRT